MLQLAWPWMLAAVVAPIAVLLIAPRAPDCAGARIRIPFFDEALRWSGRAGGSRRFICRGVALLAWCALVLAAARPQWVGDPVALPVHGRDLMLAVDLSGSMRARDMMGRTGPERRIDAVKWVASDFVARRDGDRVGLVVFGSRAHLLTPFTLDLDAVSQVITETVLGLAGEQTAIGDAIGLAVKRLRARPKAHRVLVLLTDGADTASRVEPRTAARYAAGEGIVIHAIGVGADEVASSDRPDAGAAHTALDETTLQAVAGVTGGRYFRARDVHGLEEIYRRIDALEPIAGDDEVFRPSRDVFHWPLGLSAILFALVGFAGVLTPRSGLRSVSVARGVTPGDAERPPPSHPRFPAR